MGEHNTHFRLSLLNVPDDLTPLKFPHWLRSEAEYIDRQSRASGMRNNLTLIRLFLPARLRSAIGQQRLDRILQNLVDQLESLYRIELRIVKATLTQEELLAESGIAEAEMTQIVRSDPSSDEPPTLH